MQEARALMENLEDPSKTCVLLLSTDDSDSEDDVTQEVDPSPYAARDFPGGYEQRLEVYRRAWESCLKRIQSIVHALHAPVVDAVTNSVRNAHSKAHRLPGLPYPELPVVAVSGSNSSVIADVVSQLGNNTREKVPNGKGKARMADETEGQLATRAVVTHLYPADCPNLLSAMKSIVTSFVERQNGGEDDVKLPHPTKRKPTTSLANHDLNLLKVWYKALLKINDDEPNLVIVLHNFEQHDTSVMEDVFDICSQHLPDLPLVFLLAMSSPSPATYMKSAFSRQTRALLRVHVHGVASGIDTAQRIIERTFFDLEFTPAVMLGPGILEFLVDFCSRHCASVDAIVTILQLAFMKHFEEPFTIFALGGEPDLASGNSSQPFLRSLATRLWSEAIPDDSIENVDVPEYLQAIDWDKPSSADLFAAVEGAHADFLHVSEHLRLGYRVLRLVQEFMRSNGYKSSASSTGKEEPLIELMYRVVKGRVARDVKYLGMMVKKLPGHQLDALLSKLYSFFFQLEPAHLRNSERESIIQWRSILPKSAEETNVDPETRAACVEVATEVAEWLIEYLEQRLVTLDSLVLWEAWFTGSTPFPSELINPAPRPTIVNALLHPHETLQAHSQLFSPNAAPRALPGYEYQLWELPDTSILFTRYMEAGKMINVYDWFESFAVVLDSQRRRDKQAREPKTPNKGKGKGRVKKKGVEEDEEEMDEEEEEAWRIEVQARFIRALHELDYMGFIKHTGRKADHVLRTIYDIPDE